MKNGLKCTAKEIFDRPICPIMSHQYQCSGSTACAGESCVFCREGDCLLAYKAALEVELLKRQLASNSSSIFKHTCENGITHTCLCAEEG